MKVLKFGGASLSDASRINKVADIICGVFRQDKPVVVVSALQGVTDSLISAVDLHESNRDEEAIKRLTALYKRHLAVLSELDLPAKYYALGQSRLDMIFGGLFSGLFLDRKRHDGWYDDFLSGGEKLSAYLVSLTLIKKGLKGRYFDSADLIITDSSFGCASPIMKKTVAAVEKFLFPVLFEDCVPVVTGFYGGTVNGRIALLGRGGSDYSATILAHALDASEVILWKEVDGIYDSDPKINKNARFLPEITYENALKMAKNGAKILHPDAMKPVADKSIIVRIKNTFYPDSSRETKIWRGACGHAA